MINIRELDEVLIKDVGNKIASSDKSALTSLINLVGCSLGRYLVDMDVILYACTSNTGGL